MIEKPVVKLAISQSGPGAPLLVRCPVKKAELSLKHHCFGCRHFAGFSFGDTGIIECRGMIQARKVKN